MRDLSFLLKLSHNSLLLDACSFQVRVIKEPEEKRRKKVSHLSGIFSKDSIRDTQTKIFLKHD